MEGKDLHAAHTGARYEGGVSCERSVNIIGDRALIARLGVSSESKSKRYSGDVDGLDGEHCP
jgi:hypothetical protein